jgi:P27 family predicted phage terminase small subunit
MAKRGRKKKPTALKILHGDRKDRIPVSEPRAVAGLPEKPAHLDEDASAEWDRIVGELNLLGVLSKTDGPALALYCSAFSRWVRANKQLEAKLISTTDKGSDKVNPHVTIAAQAEALMLKILAEFGCTPSSRANLSMVSSNDAPKDKLGSYIAQRRNA